MNAYIIIHTTVLLNQLYTYFSGLVQYIVKSYFKPKFFRAYSLMLIKHSVLLFTYVQALNVYY